MMTYGHLAAPDIVVVMTMYYSDETRLVTYSLDLAFVKKLHDTGTGHWAVPYGLGVWNTPHLRPESTQVSPAELLRRKRELDPCGLMNPGKGVARLRLMNPSVVRFGMGALAAAARTVRSSH